MNEEPVFLTRQIVDGLHDASLRRFSGSPGVRDDGLVESALGAAINTYLYANGDLFDISAAYAFHIAQAQAFVDGNKRTGIGCALTFLALNGIPVKTDDGTLYEAMIAIAERRLDKPGLAQVMRSFFSAP
ncbi:MAG: Death-on-curing protein [Verrucomicrobiaceae bacterium]|nr:Death-on-curing protein [Verrucomicrobiaceae bacterium]